MQHNVIVMTLFTRRWAHAPRHEGPALVRGVLFQLPLGVLTVLPQEGKCRRQGKGRRTPPAPGAVGGVGDTPLSCSWLMSVMVSLSLAAAAGSAAAAAAGYSRLTNQLSYMYSRLTCHVQSYTSDFK